MYLSIVSLQCYSLSCHLLKQKWQYYNHIRLKYKYHLNSIFRRTPSPDLHIPMLIKGAPVTVNLPLPTLAKERERGTEREVNHPKLLLSWKHHTIDGQNPAPVDIAKYPTTNSLCGCTNCRILPIQISNGSIDRQPHPTGRPGYRFGGFDEEQLATHRRDTQPHRDALDPDAFWKGTPKGWYHCSFTCNPVLYAEKQAKNS